MRRKRSIGADRNLKNHELFYKIVDAVNVGIMVATTDANIVYANPAWQKETGYSLDEVLGKNPRFLKSGKTLPATYEEMWRALSNGQQYATEAIINKRKDGSEYESSHIIFPIKDENGKIVFYAEFDRDVTEYKKLERAKTEFVSLAAHQLRTPLAATKWIIELLRESDNLTAKQKERISDLYVSNERLISLVNDLLNVARIESGKKVISKAPANLLSVIKSAIAVLQSEADSKKQKINLSAGTIVNKSQLDPMFLEEAVRNLLSNAIAYSPEGSVIEVTVGLKDKNYLVSINNRGLPIPESERDKIFSKFYRTPEAKKMKPTGSGLGLFLVKSTIEAHGGRVWYESNRRHGTTFYFTIPKK